MYVSAMYVVECQQFGILTEIQYSDVKTDIGFMLV